MTEQLDMFASANYELTEELEKKHEQSQKENLLTPRQWELWRLVEHNSLVEHRKTTQKEICEKISGYEWNDKENVHDHCPAVWKDIKDNNESLEHDKIIISKNFEYWLGSERETREFIANLWKALSPRLQRYWKFLSKLELNGQGKLLTNQKTPMSDKAKLFHEVFNDYDIEMQNYETNNSSDTE